MNSRSNYLSSSLLLTLVLPLSLLVGNLFADDDQERGEPWPRHTIDGTSRGADGVRLDDVNGDGLMDIVTGWEQGGVTRVYLNPGYAKSRRQWPAVTVGESPNVEDAVFIDLDADGRTDVVSSCEGKTRTMFVHWAPKPGEDYLDADAWSTEPIPASQGRMAWMFCMPMQVDGRAGIDLVAAGKGSNAQIGWFEIPETARAVESWTWHPIGPAGWIMSLKAHDIDADGLLDVLTTDRKGPMHACRWLRNPGTSPNQKQPWENQYLGGTDREVMFMAMADLDGSGSIELLCPAKETGILILQRQPSGTYHPTTIPMPANTGTGKGIAVGAIDGDDRADIVFSCENAHDTKSGLLWLSRDSDSIAASWTAHEISGPTGIKFDRIELLDLDGDGDLDVLTCEESQPFPGDRQGLGVIWYENPMPSRQPRRGER